MQPLSRHEHPQLAGFLHTRLCPRKLLPYPAALLTSLTAVNGAVERCSVTPEAGAIELLQAKEMFRRIEPTATISPDLRAWLRFARTLRVYMEIVQQEEERHRQPTTNSTGTRARIDLMIYNAHTVIYDELVYIYNQYSSSVVLDMLAQDSSNVRNPTYMHSVAQLVPMVRLASTVGSTTMKAVYDAIDIPMPNADIVREVEMMYKDINTAMYIIFNCDTDENKDTVYKDLFSLEDPPEVSAGAEVREYKRPVVLRKNKASSFPPELLADMENHLKPFISTYATSAVCAHVAEKNEHVRAVIVALFPQQQRN